MCWRGVSRLRARAWLAVATTVAAAAIPEYLARVMDLIKQPPAP
jgi:hypothetical protein